MTSGDNLLDSFDHFKSHDDAHVSVIGSINRHSTHAVVAVSQKLDPHALQLLHNSQGLERVSKLIKKSRCSYLGLLIELAVEFIESSHQLFGAQLSSQDSEIDDVSKQDAANKVGKFDKRSNVGNGDFAFLFYLTFSCNWTCKSWKSFCPTGDSAVLLVLLPLVADDDCIITLLTCNNFKL